MNFFLRVLALALLTGSPSMAVVPLDIGAVTEGCARGNCAVAVRTAIGEVIASGASAADIDASVSAIAGELVALVQANPALAPAVAEGLTAAANAASRGSPVGTGVREAAATVAAGNAAAIDISAIASAGGQPPRPENPTSGTNASRS